MFRYRFDTSEKALRHFGGTQKNEPCFILGNGWSLDTASLSLLDDRLTIGLNRIYSVYDPTILFFQDLAIWHEGRETLPKMNCLKVNTVRHDPLRGFLRTRILGGSNRLVESAAYLFGTRQSMLQAYQIAFVMGCNPIVLLGADCCYRGKQTSFYGINTHHTIRSMPTCESVLRWIKENAGDREIISCGANTVFEHTDLSDVLARLSQGLGRAAYLERLGFKSLSLPARQIVDLSKCNLVRRAMEKAGSLNKTAEAL